MCPENPLTWPEVGALVVVGLSIVLPPLTVFWLVWRSLEKTDVRKQSENQVGRHVLGTTALLVSLMFSGLFAYFLVLTEKGSILDRINCLGA